MVHRHVGNWPDPAGSHALVAVPDAIGATPDHPLELRKVRGQSSVALAR